MIQKTGIQVKDKYYYITAKYKTVKGFIILDGFTKIDADIKPIGLVDKINEALNSFRVGMPDLEDSITRKQYMKELKKLGFKTEKEFNKGARYCSITKNDNTIEFQPSKCVLPQYYFGFLPKEKQIVEADAPKEKIYETLMEAFRRCKTSEEA